MKRNEDNIEEIQKFRLTNGKKRLENKLKPCLRCGSDFISEGPHNRMCLYCRGAQSEYDPTLKRIHEKRHDNLKNFQAEQRALKESQEIEN